MPTPPKAEDDGKHEVAIKKQRNASEKLVQDRVCNALHEGAIFQGFQSSRLDRYRVELKISQWHRDSMTCTGDLKIFNLTPEFPELTTCFQAEVIGYGKASFITNQWRADYQTDIEHWTNLPGFKMSWLRASGADYNPATERYVYLRLKEEFVANRPNMTRIHGASFSGFYYAVFDTHWQLFEALYYHHDTEKFQRLRAMYTQAQPMSRAHWS
eukprot:TRINITY_DN9946_c0_g1_i1.p2 TRINITY_DN9946_c0_g1~~TRINITY_DN9946_c0_g1_i1.p2  ORF type:complete len:213 (+),score=32.45 TRINITY_DN9946_c0_g1_i1:87-725(+)